MRRSFWSLVLAAALPACTGSPLPDEDIDSDGDGLTDSDEAELGTDPDAVDTDGDGHEDGEESSAGTNPLNQYLHPYIGGYDLNDFDVADLPEPSEPSVEIRLDFFNRWNAYAAGDVPQNFRMIDQYGDTVDLYSFFGKHIMLAVGAEWCGPCIAAASQAQAEQDALADDGVQIIEIVVQDAAGDPADLATGARWAERHGLTTVPSLAAGDVALPEDANWDENAFSSDQYIPTFVHIGPDMRLLSVDEGYDSPEPWL